MQTERKPRKLTGQEKLTERIMELAGTCKLNHWSELIEPVDIPADLVPALMAGRPELLRLAQPRDMTAAEVAKLYKLIWGLIETNMALHQHASDLAVMVKNWQTHFTGLERIGHMIGDFANFRQLSEEDEEEARAA